MAELIVRVVELKGSYKQMGYEQGVELKSQPLFEHQMDQQRGLTVHSNSLKAKELVKSLCPNFFQELQGLAEGLDMDLEATIKQFSGYDLTFPSMGCTTMVKKGFYVRNYDFSPELYDGRFVITNPNDGYATVGFSQQIVGRLDGMNEKGLVVGLHFVNDQYRGPGFIATTIVRMVLEQCADTEEAIAFITNLPHGYCYNFSITDQSGKSAIIEASPDKQMIHYTDMLMCTNHFESEPLRAKNRAEVLSSIKRKEYLYSMQDHEQTPFAAYQLFNDENSPLFFQYYKEYFGTLHTVVYSPKELKVLVGVGGDFPPLEFSLREYLQGKSSLPDKLIGKIKM
ncbi:C45 family peptidase [Sutcliffiella horikoshii]|uniref:C45 family autoproteolytic acyltransferase/hydolase n=1 Tax=Sutcliffiella horikoshii TaxID=79883 RepID=UPI00384C0D29